MGERTGRAAGVNSTHQAPLSRLHVHHCRAWLGMRLAAGVVAGTGPGPYEEAHKPVSSFMAVLE